MKIVVLMKEVPDTYGDRMLDLETGLADRGASELVLDEIGERALELALTYADMHSDTEVTVLSMGPAPSAASIRKALAMGAGSAVHILDDELIGADVSLTAEALAAAIRKVGFDLVIAGNLSTDGAGGVVPAMVAELLGIPSMTALSAVELSKERVSGTRSTETANVQVTSALPAVISVTEALPDARFATFKGIMAAKKKPTETLSLADLGVSALDPAAARSILTAVARKPQRAAGVKVTDAGDAGAKLAEFLVLNRLV
jgi:electron transfer flavoprotein beta subunit